jgi:predicted RNA binding protein YcfA (HicA-like mRNA interferase family)
MPLSGKKMLKLYLEAGWLKEKQNATSHVKVKKGSNIEIIPMHKELRKGLESKLLKKLKNIK